MKAETIEIISQVGSDRSYHVDVQVWPGGVHPVVLGVEVEFDNGQIDSALAGLSVEKAQQLQYALLKAINKATEPPSGPGGAA